MRRHSSSVGALTTAQLSAARPVGCSMLLRAIHFAAYVISAVAVALSLGFGVFGPSAL